MNLPNNWTIEEVLSLTYYRKVSISLIKRAVESFDCLDELLNPASVNDISAKFRQGELFINSGQDPIEEAKKQIEFCEKNKVKIISFWDDSYPSLLKEIHIPPVLLFVKGQLQNPDSFSISMVGTRTCSTYGRLIAEDFAATFARNGIIVTSGLAYGIDTISHLSAVMADGISYAVLGSGIDKMTSSFAVKNAKKIIDADGAIISEFKCGTTAKPAYFPQRNRIISGISKATLIIESGIKGGSLITAGFALEQNRDVFSVPGDIRSEKSKGTNLLIKKSMATPALSPKEVLEDLGFSSLLDDKKEQHIKLDAIEQKIYNVLNFEPVHIDKISTNTNIDITEIMVKLLNMEFNGIVRQLPGKHYIRAV